ncbi:hypothetical protein [Halovivax cerinus]|uniref:Aminoglycoside phosphotransferase domain-containing protein n=1 Tax=Halovivax cerinus TaxID=1487865 RepID=A0ABD5NPG9_9EURY|nr:hypothetical protein [Halovivax cerinus]
MRSARSDEARYRRLADLLARLNPADAFDEFVRTSDRGDEILKRFLQTRTACWRLLLPEELRGRCLVCGFRPGQTGILLSAIADSVTVLSGSEPELGATRAIASVEHAQIETVRGSLDTLPVEPNSFNTVVVTATRSELNAAIEALDAVLDRDGTLVVLTNGLPREAKLTDLLGIELEPVARDETLTSALGSTKRAFRQLFARSGFDECETFARLSSARRKNEWVFDVSDRDVVEWVFGANDKAGITGPLRLGKALARLSAGLGLLDQCYPEYLFVAKRSGTPVTRDGLLMSGRNRSTLLAIEEGTITEAVKLPNSTRQSVFNANEAVITARLRDDSVTGISQTRLEPSPFGPQLVEEPINGTTLKHRMEPTPEALHRTGSIAIDWLVGLQKACRGKRVRLSHAELAARSSSGDRLLSSPDSPPDHLDLFPAPVHGDFFGSNVYVESERVTRVIDWERGELDGNPIIDPAFFLLQYADYVGETFCDGFRTMFVDDRRYRAVVSSLVGRYCDGVGLSRDAFLACFPEAYARRPPIAKGINWRLDIDWIDRLRYIRSHAPALERTIGEDPHARVPSSLPPKQ